MDDKRYWVGFTLVKGIGSVRLQGLLEYFGDAATAWNASPLDLVSAGLSRRLAERVVQLRKRIVRKACRR